MKEKDIKTIEYSSLMLLAILLICFIIWEVLDIGIITNLTIFLSLTVFLLSFAMIKLFRRIRELEKEK